MRYLLITCFAATGLFAQDIIRLDQAVQEAIDHNLNLLAERYNIGIADARIIQARLRPNPVFSYGQDYQDVFRQHFTLDNGAGPPEWNARVDFVLERGGKRERRVELAQSLKSVAEFQLLNTIRQLQLDVQNAFLDVQAAKESLTLAQENYRSFEGIVEINTARVKAGDLAEVELMRTRVALLQFRSQIQQAELRLRSARTRLKTLLGRSVASGEIDVAGPIRRDANLVALEEVQADSLRLRPDLLALRRDQARSQADLRLQIAQGKVDFTVGTEYHKQYGPVQSSAMGFFFSAPIPVFNRNQGEVERARREDRQIEARIRTAEAQIGAEVATAYDQYLTSRNLVESIERNMIQQAREVRNITEYSYRRGEASFIEFLDAQRALNETMQAYNDARADFARNLFLLEAVSGRGVNP